MKEFFDALSLALTGFPPVLTNIITAGGGGAVAVIVAIKTSPGAMSLGDIAGQFLVCWLTGAILGPSLMAALVQNLAGLFAPGVQSIIKLPNYAICFLTSGIGWWIWTKLIPKKQEQLLNRTPPGEGTQTHD